VKEEKKESRIEQVLAGRSEGERYARQVKLTRDAKVLMK